MILKNNKKLIFSIFNFFIISLFFVSYAFSSITCNFDDSKCSRFSEPFVEINLSLDNDKNKIYIEKVEPKIYLYENNANARNFIKLTIEEKDEKYIIRNLVPFTKPGNYILQVDLKLKSGDVSRKVFSVIFDNLEPIKPSIENKLIIEDDKISPKVFYEKDIVNLYYRKNIEGDFKKIDSYEKNKSELIDLKLDEGLNFFEFYSQNKKTNKRSQISRKYFYRTNLNFEDFGFENFDTNSINIFDLEKYNDFTFKSSQSYITRSRLFYISGDMNKKNNLVLINNYKTFSDLNGNFGAFILLNDGRNLVEIRSNNSKKIIKVNYIKEDFEFLKVGFNKVIKEKSNELKVKVNFGLEVDIYLNGKLEASYSPNNNGEINYGLKNIKEGKNYLTLKSKSGKLFSDVFYYDKHIPEIEVFDEKVSNIKKVKFGIKDNISGIDYSKTKVVFNGMTFEKSQIKSENNFFYIDFSKLDLSDGIYNGQIEIYDLAGNRKQKGFKINVSKKHNFIEDIIFSQNDVYLKNDKIYLKKLGLVKLNIRQSNNFVYDKIYLNGRQLPNYEIFRNKINEIEIDFLDEKGEIIFEIVDNNYNKKNQTFFYEVTSSPKIEIDFVRFTKIYNRTIVKIFGSILDKENDFDKSSFLINEDTNYNFYNNFFEGIIDLEDDLSLTFRGLDYNLNSIENQISNIFEKVLYDLEKEDFKNNFVVLSFKNNQNNYDNILKSFDGQNVFTILYNTKIFSFSQINGIRNFKNVYFNKDFKFEKNFNSKIDFLKPQIFILNGSENIKIILKDDSDISSFNFYNDDNLIDDYSDCQSTGNCYLVNKNNLEKLKVIAIDEFDNREEKILTLSDNNFDLPPKEFDLDFSFTNTLKSTINNKVRVEGNIFASREIKNVSIKNKEGYKDNCEFSDSSFSCEINLENGKNDIFVKVEAGAQTLEKNIEVEKLFNDLDINLEEIKAKSINFVNGNYYTTSKDIDILADVNKKSLIKLFFGGNKKLEDEKGGSFTIKMNIEKEVSNNFKSEFDIFLIAKNENFEKTSNKVRLIYQNYFNAILKINLEK